MLALLNWFNLWNLSASLLSLHQISDGVGNIDTLFSVMTQSRVRMAVYYPCAENGKPDFLVILLHPLKWSALGWHWLGWTQ
jgi:hypothetical protein